MGRGETNRSLAVGRGWRAYILACVLALGGLPRRRMEDAAHTSHAHATREESWRVLVCSMRAAGSTPLMGVAYWPSASLMSWRAQEAVKLSLLTRSISTATAIVLSAAMSIGAMHSIPRELVQASGLMGGVRGVVKKKRWARTTRRAGVASHSVGSLQQQLQVVQQRCVGRVIHVYGAIGQLYQP